MRVTYYLTGDAIRESFLSRKSPSFHRHSLDLQGNTAGHPCVHVYIRAREIAEAIPVALQQRGAERRATILAAAMWYWLLGHLDAAQKADSIWLLADAYGAPVRLSQLTPALDQAWHKELQFEIGLQVRGSRLTINEPCVEFRHALEMDYKEPWSLGTGPIPVVVSGPQHPGYSCVTLAC